MAFLSGYTSRWEYKVLASKVPSTQTDYPVYVDLGDMPASFWSTVADGGGDIRVTRSDGTTECAREVVSCDTSTDTGELHFLANSVDGTTDTVFYIYANGTSADYAVGATFGRNAVWGDYAFVQHYDGDNTESTENTYTITDNSITYNSANGKLGQGAIFAGSGASFINVAHNTPLSITNWTITNWFRRDSTASATEDSFFYAKQGESSSSGRVNYSMRLGRGAQRANGLLDGIFWNGSSFQIILTDTAVANNTDWNNLVWTKNGNTNTLYFNGANIKTTTTSGTPSTGAFPLNVGRTTDMFADNRPHDGDLDELRISSVIRSGDRITAEYNNQNDHSTWATIGAEETDGGGATFNNFKGFGGL